MQVAHRNPRAQPLARAIRFSSSNKGVNTLSSSSFHIYRKSLQKSKNRIHLGSEGAGPRIAATISVIETCRRLQIRPRSSLGIARPAPLIPASQAPQGFVRKPFSPNPVGTGADTNLLFGLNSEFEESAALLVLAL
jgi:hypothetical protein